MEVVPAHSKSHINFRSPLHLQPPSFISSFRDFAVSVYQFLLFHANPLWIQLCYFFFVSSIGFLLLKILPMRDAASKPEDFDLFFMAVSANTVSSMVAVEMESFSNSQLVILTLLMLVGGEVFTSIVGLQFTMIKLEKKETPYNKAGIELSSKVLAEVPDQLELGTVESGAISPESGSDLRYNSIKHLGFVVLGYFLVFHVTGYVLILVYLSLIPSARAVLEGKGIHFHTFSIFTMVSSFTNCGFIPTNENMMVFKNCSGLLLMIVVQILAGNTMFPSFLRLVIWILKKHTKRQEYDYMVRNHGEMGFDHLLPGPHAVLLALTVLGFVLVQLILFCCLEWRSEGLDGLNPYRKIVGSLFQSVNSRHAGESIVDISTVSPAILVLYVVMMYLPPCTSFIPLGDGNGPSERKEGGSKRKNLVQNLTLSQLSILAIFVIIICITERKKLSEDPLNFSFLNIVIEVISAFGNVGFSTGYSCKRQLKPTGQCVDTWVGFSGKWSTEGKLTLIAVMLFGRLKKFSMGGGRAWKLG
ncbi:cation transporter HKT8-like [Phoenix dactylifera]|uniref:Cation transporter HKT8-like n=1 Tax=Phoenix dactylifera TaxID=42345 RepID=A0A8B7BN46_PHODC|nr:cation transporter HKT8-like [Phoenix dactylifera]